MEQFKLGREGEERKGVEEDVESSLACVCVGVLLKEYEVRSGDGALGVLLLSDFDGERETSVTLSLEAGIEVGISLEAVGGCLKGASLE